MSAKIIDIRLYRIKKQEEKLGREIREMDMQYQTAIKGGCCDFCATVGGPIRQIQDKWYCEECLSEQIYQNRLKHLIKRAEDGEGI